MTAPATTVRIFFGTTPTASTLFTLDDPTRGVLNNSTYTLGGDSGTDVTATAYCPSLTFTRGRTSQIFDEIDPASGSIVLGNETRVFDPFNTAGPYYGLIKPGLRIQVTTAGVVTFDGKIADWNFQYTQWTGTAVASLEDGLATLGRQQFTDWTATASQTAGPRLTAILNRSEVAWSGGARSLDTGVSTLQGDNVTWGSNVLNYCQLVAKSDLGTFFASRDGILTFKDRHSTIGATTAVTFADDGTGIPFDSISTASGSETYYTRVSVDCEGGTAQTVTSSAAATDGYRTLSLSGLLQDSDSQALDMAQYLAGIYSTPEDRISELVIDLNEFLTAAQTAAVLALDINSVVAVKWTPASTGAQVNQSCIVQGITHDLESTNHTVTLHLGKLQQRTAFILDSSTLGVLDTGPNVLSF